jgi:predicted O-methyltransferase YrrM
MPSSPETFESSFLQRTGLVLTDAFVRLAPRAVLRSLALSLARHRGDTLIHTVTTYDRGFDLRRLPSGVEDFGDLAFLFWLTPMNRGILRQDFDEAALLYRTLRDLDPIRGVEIGRYSGGSTVLIAAAMQSPEALFTSIDAAPVADDVLRKVLTHLNLLERVELVKGHSGQVEWPAEPALDFVFIDGDHTYEGARRDHLQWGPRVRPGGLIIHHDMARARPHATSRSDLYNLRAMILERQADDLELVAEAGSLSVFCRRGQSWTTF